VTVTLNLVVEPHHDAMLDDDPVGWTAGYVAGVVRGAGVHVVSCGVRMPVPGPSLAQLERERHPTLKLEPETPDTDDGWATWAEDDIPASAEAPAVEPADSGDALAALDVGPGLRQALATAADTMHELDAAAADPHLDPHPGGPHADLVQQRGDERRATAADLSAAFPMERRPFDPDAVRAHQADSQRGPGW